MKKILIVIIFAISLTCFSQKVKGFGGLGLYLNRSYDNSGYVSVNTGLEYKINNFLKPEIEFEYFIGALQDRTTENESGIETELLVRTVNASNISIIPKINFGDEDDKTHFQILPMYNLTKVVAQGSLFTLNDKKNDLIKTDTDKFNETRQSLGIGLGVYFDLSEQTFQSIALNIYYNNIDIGNALTNLKFQKENFSTKQTLGIEIKYYFGFSKKNK